MQPLQRLLDLAQADTHAELLGRLVLEVVGLVDDEVVERGDRAPAGREIGEEEGVVDDDDVRRLGRPPRAVEEAAALAHKGVLAGEAVDVGRGEAAPGERLAGAEPELGAVARPGLGEPERERRGQPRDVGVAQARLMPRDPALQAEVVSRAP